MHDTGQSMQHGDFLYFLWRKHLQCRLNGAKIDSQLLNIVFLIDIQTILDLQKDEALQGYYIKRLRLGKTTSWQHRIFDLTILSPIWLGTYEYMISTLQIFFFRFEKGTKPHGGYISQVQKSVLPTSCFRQTQSLKCTKL